MVDASHVALANRPSFKRTRVASRREENARAMPTADEYAIALIYENAICPMLKRKVKTTAMKLIQNLT
ncbi:MAG: hypothetical protein ACYTXY_31065, partial [Nostoc sp.]